MGVYHLISIEEDQLRNWHGDHDELLRNVGAAVVLACLDPESSGVCIREASPGPEGEGNAQSLIVRHVDQHEGDAFAMWAWETADSVCIADLGAEDLETLGKLVEVVRKSRAGPE